MPMHLSSLLPMPNPEEYKVHLACWNGKYQPLDVFVRDREDWDKWNTWRSQKDEFNKTYIFALIDFYPEPGIWLFGGIYKVLSRAPANHSHSYTVERMPDHDELVGRLKIRFTRPGRIRSVKLENYYPQMVVSELLREPYTGERFPGYENINHDFGALEVIFGRIVRTGRQPSKTSRASIKLRTKATERNTWGPPMGILESGPGGVAISEPVMGGMTS